MSENVLDRKYEITDIAHPEYPQLHRIRALRDIGQSVRKGDLGGYVECEDNLSQQGNCWLFGEAISCENAVIRQNAVALGNAVIRGSAFVAGSTRIENHAVIEDNAIVMAGCIEFNARISGFARIGANPVTNHFPFISQDAIVYGEVSGKVDVCGHTVILPGAKIDMPTNDTLRIEDSKVSILRFETNEPPKQKPRRVEPER